jgi:hypothetical protein
MRIDLREIGGGWWFGFYWLRIGTGGELLWVRCWTFMFLRHRVSVFLSLFWDYSEVTIPDYALEYNSPITIATKSVQTTVHCRQTCCL